MILTETGAPSVDGANTCTACWASATATIDDQEQADIYQAITEVYAAESAAMNAVGVFFWGVNAFQPNAGEARDFTFRAKPAEAHVKRFYGAP